jgi:RNA polymerase sigma factor (TIGR02999 family)
MAGKRLDRCRAIRDAVVVSHGAIAVSERLKQRDPANVDDITSPTSAASSNSPAATISSLITAVERGDFAARESLFAALYTELHQMARRELARSGGAGILGVTTLLHEAYVAMARRGPDAAFPDRARFMGYAAHVMRGLIIDLARERHTLKRGGQFHLTTLDTNVEGQAVDHVWLSDLSAALDELATVDPLLAEVVEMKFFCGFSVPEIAALSDSSVRTVHRRWEKARLYLHEYLRSEPD